MKKILALAFIISTTTTAQEPLRNLDQDLLQPSQVPLAIDTKKFKKLVDDAKKTDSNVYDIETENRLYKNEPYSKTRIVTFLPYAPVLTARGNNYITFRTTYNYLSKDWSYVIHKKSYDCGAKVLTLINEMFLDDGSFLSTNAAQYPLPEETPMYKQFCIDNPNKKQ